MLSGLFLLRAHHAGSLPCSTQNALRKIADDPHAVGPAASVILTMHTWVLGRVPTLLPLGPGHSFPQL